MRASSGPTLARGVAALFSLLLLDPETARATLPADPPGTSAVLPSPPRKHWVWVNDFVFPQMADGMAHLVDGDTGRYLGLLSTGQSFVRVVLPRDGRVIYSPEIYFSRGTRGKRTDVVTVYDAATLKVLREIPIPAKRSSNLPMMGNSVLTDDDRFLLIYNFNPAQSVSVVDTIAGRFVGEIDTAGCALIYPTGPRSFFTLCADGGVVAVTLNEQGRPAAKVRTAPLFDVMKDPVTEKGVRLGNTWLFASFDGEIETVVMTPKGLERGAHWSLTTPAERAQGWRPGGLQHLAVHAGRHELYSIMHQGGRDTHKNPGKQIWVYDLATSTRVRKIAAKNLSGSIQLSTDEHPLLFSIFADSSTLDIYDPVAGTLTRSVDNIGTTPALLVTP